MRAAWHGVVLAESDDTVVVEGDHRSICPWKGVATYYTIEVDGNLNENAAWKYESPSILARNIEGPSPSGETARS